MKSKPLKVGRYYKLKKSYSFIIHAIDEPVYIKLLKRKLSKLGVYVYRCKISTPAVSCAKWRKCLFKCAQEQCAKQQVICLLNWTKRDLEPVSKLEGMLHVWE